MPIKVAKLEYCYLQLGGGSRVISANSFWILLAEVERALEPKALEPRSLVFLSLSEAVAAVDEELEEDIFFFFCLKLQKHS